VRVHRTLQQPLIPAEARIKVRTVPGPVVHTAGTVLGPVVPMVKDMAAMLDWFQTGRYVADTTRQREVFGTVPTAEDAVARFISSLGHVVRDRRHPGRSAASPSPRRRPR
jgi:hypothetical protein